MEETKPEEKPKVGSIQFKNGGATIVTEEGTVPFDTNFVLTHCKKALKKSRPGFYTSRIQEYLKDLKTRGLDAIPDIKPKLEALKAGKDINRSFIDQVNQWLNYLSMMKNIKTAPPEEKKDEEENKLQPVG
jgi:hypothetical protein